MRFSNFFCVVIACLAAVSCASKKDILYLQDANRNREMQLLNYEPTLKPDDMLSIIISSETPDATIPFNLPAIQGNYEVGNNQNGIKTYLIDNFGNIDFPVLGKLKLGGLTRTEASNKIVTAMSEYIKDPSVNLRILNYKISVLGEVNKPGTVPIESERITILEALSAAGDLTIYGKRDNILVIRETDGKKTYARIDLTKSDFTTSPYYYLTQNDVIVVEPNQTRMNSSVVGPNLTVIISGLSLLTAIMVIIFR